MTAQDQGGGADAGGHQQSDQDPMPPWLADALTPIRHLRLYSPDDDLAIAVQYDNIDQVAEQLSPFSPHMSGEGIRGELKHSARINWSRINAGEYNLHQTYLTLEQGNDHVELSVYPFWRRDFRQGLRGLGLTGHDDPITDIDDLADTMITAAENRRAGPGQNG